MGSKNSGSGITWVVGEDKLLEKLNKEQEELDNLLDEEKLSLNELKEEIPEEDLSLIDRRCEIKRLAKVWLNLYHSLVLLHAATDPPGPNGIDRREEGDGSIDYQCNGQPYCIPNSHKIPAWSSGDVGEEGWLGKVHPEDSLIGRFETEFIKDANNQNKKLSNYVDILDIAVPLAMPQKYRGRPVLQHLLIAIKIHFQDARLGDINLGECLETCLLSDKYIEPGDHENRVMYVKEALYRIASILDEGITLDSIEELRTQGPDIIFDWAEQVTSHLEEVDSWRETEGINNFNELEFISWLRDKHKVSPQAETTGDLLNAAISGDDEKAKWVVAGMIAMLRFNTKTLELISRRCFDEDNEPPFPGLRDTIQHLTDKLPLHNPGGGEPDYRDAWKKLQFATLGIITWHIFQQITPAIGSLKEIIIGD